MKSYEELLQEAYNDVKIIENAGERFEVPKIEGLFEGKKTILTNVSQIVSYLRREEDSFIKYLLKELAVKGQKEGDRVIIIGKISSKKIQPKIDQYVKEFVICKECGKPDTQIVKDKKTNYIHCLACGAKHPTRPI